MKHRCPKCGHEYELTEHTLPDCPHCVRAKMVHPDGLSPKHTLAGALASSTFASYIADGVRPDEIFDYITGGTHTGPSGCEIYYSTKHKSFNAVSYRPLGEIPGSGIGPSGHHAAEFAVLVDIEGKSNQGPHLMFEDQANLQLRRTSGEWQTGPKCATCGVVPVLQHGAVCLNCQSASGKP